MVAAMMTEFEFIRPAAQCEPEYLMTEADPEDGLLSHKFFCILYAIRDGLGVPRTVAEDYSVRIYLYYRFRGCPSRDNGDFTAGFNKVPEDIEFDTKIIDNDLLNY